MLTSEGRSQKEYCVVENESSEDINKRKKQGTKQWVYKVTFCVREWKIIIYTYIFVFFYICINKQRKGKTIKVTHRSEEEWYGMGASQVWSETS